MPVSEQRFVILVPVYRPAPFVVRWIHPPGPEVWQALVFCAQNVFDAEVHAHEDEPELIIKEAEGDGQPHLVKLFDDIDHRRQRKFPLGWVKLCIPFVQDKIFGSGSIYDSFIEEELLGGVVSVVHVQVWTESSPELLIA